MPYNEQNLFGTGNLEMNHPQQIDIVWHAILFHVILITQRFYHNLNHAEWYASYKKSISIHVNRETSESWGKKKNFWSMCWEERLKLMLDLSIKIGVE